MTSDAMQLTLDGGEVPFVQSRHVSNKTPLSHGQSEIVAFARLGNGIVRPVQAGTVLHRLRPDHQHQLYRGPLEDPGKAIPCCQYAATDGVAALKRLIARGLVERISRGTYVLVGW